jgi:Uma2 family endonuclease
LKSDFYRGMVLPRPPLSYAHTLIKDNLAGEAGNQLKDGPCEVITSDLRVKVEATEFYTYPDVLFFCGTPRFEDAERDVLLNPRVIAEVLSEESETFDRGRKFAEFRRLPSLQEYILIAQDKPLVERYVRQPDETWVLRIFSDMTQTLEVVTVAAKVPLSEIYRNVNFAGGA